MKKIVTLFLIPMIALSVVGASYALWSKTITLDGTVKTGTLDKKITSLICAEFPEVEGKDVGSCTAEIGTGGDSASVIIDNAYPSYKVDISFWQQNTGSIPLKINDVILTWSGPNGVTTQTLIKTGCVYIGSPSEVEICFGDNFGVQLDAGDIVEESLTVHMLQGAVQSASYGLSLKERAVQWNEYPQ